MKDTPRDYTNLNELALSLGFKLTTKPGFYKYGESNFEIDLTACAENRIAILKTAVNQFSEQIEQDYYERKEEQERDYFNNLEQDLENI